MNGVRGPAQVQHAQDFLSDSGGNIAQRLLRNNMDIGCLRTNATLSYDEWTLLDTAAIGAFQQRLTGIEDLRTRGLTKDLGNMGVLISRYNRLSQMNEAEVSMWASTDGENADIVRDLISVPVPVIFKDFQIDIRFLAASRNGTGEPIDVLDARAAGRVVAEKLENILFNGNTTAMGDMPIYGYRTHPNRNTTSGSSWGTASNIYTNIITMVSGLRADGAPRPYVLYLHLDQYMEMMAISDTTRQLNEMRVALENIPELESIKFSDQMTAGEAVMVSMNMETVDLAIAEDFTTVEWESKGPLATNFRNMFVGVPRVKADFEGRSGIYHMTGI